MGKKKNNYVSKSQQPLLTQQGASMSTKTELMNEVKNDIAQVETQQAEILDKQIEIQAKLEEAAGKKTTTNRVGGESDTKKAGDDVTVVDVLTYVPKQVWDKGIKPTWNFGKGAVLKAWDRTVGFFEAEKKLATDLGAGKYMLDRLATISLKVLKMAAVVTLAYFISEMVMGYFGFELFAPQSLLIIGLIALACIIIKSILDQRQQGSEVKGSVIGSHVTEALCAA